MIRNPVTAPSSAIIPLPASQTETLAQVLANAFHYAPNFTYMLPNVNKRREVLPWFFAEAIRDGQLYGEVYTTTMVSGGAIWLRPGNHLAFLRTGLLLPFKLGWSAFQRMVNINGRLDEAQKQMTEPYWYLLALGVAPAQQGQGLGTALLQPIFHRADIQGVACYLETFSGRNLSFYERQGFEVQENGRIPDGGPTYWTMVRQPQE